MSVVDRALPVLKEKVDGIPAPETIRKVRAKLRLSQRRAGAVLRVGPNAFDKYEGGIIEPSAPTIQLITPFGPPPRADQRARADVSVRTSAGATAKAHGGVASRRPRGARDARPPERGEQERPAAAIRRTCRLAKKSTPPLPRPWRKPRPRPAGS
jgi:hypothetical protein